MLRLLRFEFRKLSCSKAFYICLAISVAMCLIVALAMKVALSVLEHPEDFVGSYGTDGLGMMKHFLDLSNFTMMNGIVTAILVCEDYTSESIKNIYAKGYTRHNIFFAKYISTLVASLVMIVVGLLTSFALGFAVFGKAGEMGENYLLSMLVIVLCALAYHAIFFSISITFRKIGGSIALNIVVPVFFQLIVTLLDELLKIKDRISGGIAQYALSGRLSILVGNDVAISDVGIGVIVALLFAAIPLVAAYIFNNKRDN